MTTETLDRFITDVATLVSTTDDDVHAVTAVGDEPTIGIYVYGGNIGTVNRRSYDPATGLVQWFVSGWDQPPVDGGPA